MIDPTFATTYLAGKTPGLIQRRLNLHHQYVIIDHEHASLSELQAT